MILAAFPDLLLESQTLQDLNLVAYDKPLPVTSPIAVPWPVRELWPFPLFCHPMSYETAIPTRPSFSPWFWDSVAAVFFSFSKISLQLFLATISTAFPISFSRLLKSTLLTGGTFYVMSKLFSWVCPIPIWRDPRTALVFTSLAKGPRLPALCWPDVFILLRFLQLVHLIVSVLLKPLLPASPTVFTIDRGPENHRFWHGVSKINLLLKGENLFDRVVVWTVLGNISFFVSGRQLGCLRVLTLRHYHDVVKKMPCSLY